MVQIECRALFANSCFVFYRVFFFKHRNEVYRAKGKTGEREEQMQSHEGLR